MVAPNDKRVQERVIPFIEPQIRPRSHFFGEVLIKRDRTVIVSVR